MQRLINRKKSNIVSSVRKKFKHNFFSPRPAIDCHYLYMEQIETTAKSGSELSRVGTRRGIRLMEINKTDILPDVDLTTGNCPTLAQCGKNGVVLCCLCSRDDKC